MGRSVDYLNNAEFVIYFPFENSYFENGEFDEDGTTMNWDDLIMNLESEIQSKLPSYFKCNKWDNRETRIILENQFCIIGLSEYCGLVSLSVACKEVEGYYGYEEQYKENFSKKHAQQIEKTLNKIVDGLTGNRLNKIGTFSNGEAVFKKAV